MEEDPKKTIYIDISTCVGQGKTITAVILREHLRRFGMSVEVKDADLSSGNYPEHFAQKAMEAKALQGRNAIIRTRQLPRNPQKGPDGEVPPGKMLI